jgi:uncharacterized protein YeaO (DUF488 family)
LTLPERGVRCNVSIADNSAGECDEESMSLTLKTYRCGSPREEDEGLRIGVVRYLPRGVKKQDYAHLDYFDVWFPTVAPSREIISEFKKTEGTRKDWDRFIRRYRKEMKEPDNRRAIVLLAEVAKRTPLSIGCYCQEADFCHRSVLRKLIEEAAGV